MLSGANVVLFAFTIRPVVEKTCSLGVEVAGTARTTRARLANRGNVSLELRQNSSTSSQAILSFRYLSISSADESTAVLETTVCFCIKFSRSFFMCPPVVFEHSTARFRFNVGDDIGDVVAGAAQTVEVDDDNGALLESFIGPDCFFTNVSIMLASSDSRVL